MLNININEFRNIEKFNAGDDRFRETKFKSEYNNKFKMNIIEIKTNRRLLKFDDDDCD